MLEDEVYRCRVERGAENEATDLDLKADSAEGVVVQHYTAYVADTLINAADEHGEKVRPCFVADAGI